MTGRGEKKSITIAVMMVMVMMMMVVVGVSRVRAAEGDECGMAIQQISSCLNYLTNGAPVPQMNSLCCRGVTNLYAHATTTPLVQRVCNCFKTEATNYHLNDLALQNLAPTCGVDLSFTISKDIDCSKIRV